MSTKLEVKDPDRRFSLIGDTDEAFLYTRHVVVEAERQIQGIQKGRERLEAVTDVLLDKLDIPIKRDPAAARMVAKLFAKTVYTSIALQIPQKLRMSKTEPPSPPRR